MDTEHASPRYSDIDLWEPADILDAMIEGQMAAVAAVRAERAAIEQAALAMEARLRRGGRLIYAGAGKYGILFVSKYPGEAARAAASASGAGQGLKK